MYTAQTQSRQWWAVVDEDCMPWTTVEVARQISLHASWGVFACTPLCQLPSRVEATASQWRVLRRLPQKRPTTTFTATVSQLVERRASDDCRCCRCLAPSTLLLPWPLLPPPPRLAMIMTQEVHVTVWESGAGSGGCASCEHPGQRTASSSYSSPDMSACPGGVYKPLRWWSVGQRAFTSVP